MAQRRAQHPQHAEQVQRRDGLHAGRRGQRGAAGVRGIAASGRASCGRICAGLIMHSTLDTLPCQARVDSSCAMNWMRLTRHPARRASTRSMPSILARVNERAQLAQRHRQAQGRGRPGLSSRARSAGAAPVADERGPLPGRAHAAPVHARSFPPAARSERAARASLISARAGHFSEEAVHQAFRRQRAARPAPRSTRCSARSRPRRLGYGVVPVENSTEGAVGRTLDLLLGHAAARSAAKSCCRASEPAVDGAADVAGATVYSPCAEPGAVQSLADAPTAGAERVPVASNAEAARAGAAEAGSRRDRRRRAAGSLTDCSCWRATSKMSPTTRRASWCSAAGCAPSGRDKTSMVMSARNRPGAMHELLTPLARPRREHDAARVAAVAHRASGSTCSSSTSKVTRSDPAVREALVPCATRRIPQDSRFLSRRRAMNVSPEVIDMIDACEAAPSCIT